MECSICMTTVSPEFTTLLPCQCSFCGNCVCNWYKEQSQDINFAHEDGKVRCPNDKCLKKFSSHQLVEALVAKPGTAHLASEVLDCLLRAYLIRTSDIRQCPTAECGYSGMLDHRACKERLVCESCGTEWRDKVHYTKWENVKYKLTSTSQFLDEMLTGMYESFLTEECPNCSVSIVKTGGCQHMTCRRCKYEFCWSCKHKHTTHNTVLCLTTIGSKVLLAFLLVLASLALTQSLYAVCLFLVKVLCLVLVYGIALNLVPISVVLIVQQLFTVSRQRNIIVFKMVIFGPILLAEGYLLVSYGYLRHFVVQMVCELIVGSLIFLFDRFKNRRLKFIL